MVSLNDYLFSGDTVLKILHQYSAEGAHHAHDDVAQGDVQYGADRRDVALEDQEQQDYQQDDHDDLDDLEFSGHGLRYRPARS